MFTIRTLNSISEKGLARLPAESYKIADDAQSPDAILLRSFAMHGMELPSSLLAVARAGAGVNNIPIDACSAKGIVVFNTPGANANAVKELAIASLLLASRDIVGGIAWAKTLPKAGSAEMQKAIEKGKGEFVGPELLGKKLGVIGLGAIGVMVANAADSLGMEVAGYDPFISVDAAWKLSRSVRKALSLNELIADSDYISIHVPLTPETKGSIGAAQLGAMKPGVRIVNLSRDGIIDTAELVKALDSGKVARYVTDFAEEELYGRSDVILMPHLGASTPEAEENCAIMAADQLKSYLEDGNIVNSVNLPACEMARSTNTRICLIHGNVPNMVGQITSALAAKGLNIADMINKSRGELAYTMIDVEGACPDECSLPLAKIPHVIRMRVLEA
jgi:D-3-phosphoglycerate dehydrogenase